MPDTLADRAEAVVTSIDLDVLKACLDRYHLCGWSDDTGLRFLRANLALAARRAAETNHETENATGHVP